jgi:hypothetical protein
LTKYRHRPDIARPGIGADQIRLAAAADAKATGLNWRETEMPIRADNPQRMIGRAFVLDRSRNRELFLVGVVDRPNRAADHRITVQGRSRPQVYDTSTPSPERRR